LRRGSYGGDEQGGYVEREIVTGGKLGLRREVYKVKYDAMALPYPQVLHSQLNLLQMRIGYPAALGEAWRLGVDLEYGTLRGGLGRP
jgi:hypothetical protein